MDLCEPCGTRFIAHQDAAHSIGETLDVSMIVAILCTLCFAGTQEEQEAPAVDVPAGTPDPEPDDPITGSRAELRFGYL